MYEKILIDAHTKTEDRIYWNRRKELNFLNFLWGGDDTSRMT